MMKALLFCLFALALPLLAAQETVPEGLEHWTADSLKQLDQTLKVEAGKNAHHIGMQRLGDFPNDTFMLSRREADGIVEWHETQADIFFVQSGSATLLVGGTMVGGETVEPHEKRNGTIQGASGASSPRGMSSASRPRCRIRSCSTVPETSPILWSR
jgi:hypothetical protein